MQMERRSWAAAAAAAGVLGALACYARHTSLRAERRNPPQGRFVDAGGGHRLHYVSSGRGRPVVLLHGASTQLQDMTTSLMPRLSQRYQVFAFDRPGHGYSDRPSYRAWAEAQARTLHAAVRRLDLEKPVIVGHSMGGGVAMAYGFLYPKELAGVVFLSGLAYPEFRPDFLKFAAPAIPLVGTLMSHTVYQPLQRLMLPSMLRRFFAPQDIPERLLRELPLEMLYRPKAIRVNAEEQMAVMPSMIDLQRQYPSYPLPVSVLVGLEDQTTDPARHGLRMASELPNVRLRRLPGLGHMIHHFAQEEVAQAVDDVFARAQQAWNAAGHPPRGS